MRTISHCPKHIGRRDQAPAAPASLADTLAEAELDQVVAAGASKGSGLGSGGGGSGRQPGLSGWADQSREETR